MSNTVTRRKIFTKELAAHFGEWTAMKGRMGLAGPQHYRPRGLSASLST